MLQIFYLCILTQIKRFEGRVRKPQQFAKNKEEKKTKKLLLSSVV